MPIYTTAKLWSVYHLCIKELKRSVEFFQRLISLLCAMGQSAFRVLMFFQLAYSHPLLYNNR